MKIKSQKKMIEKYQKQISCSIANLFFLLISASSII